MAKAYTIHTNAAGRPYIINAEGRAQLVPLAKARAAGWSPTKAKATKRKAKTTKGKAPVKRKSTKRTSRARR